MKKRRRKIPQINSSSSADIAFLLLIFFLITSSLDPRMGLYRKMNPAYPEEALKERNEIEDRNLLHFTLTGRDVVVFKEDEVPPGQIRILSKAFISNINGQDHLPERIDTEIEGLGTVAVTKNHVILLEISRDARYESYIVLLNEVTAAYNELRNEAALELLARNYHELDEGQQAAIRQLYPMRISEKELKEGEE